MPEDETEDPRWAALAVELDRQGAYVRRDGRSGICIDGDLDLAELFAAIDRVRHRIEVNVETVGDGGFAGGGSWMVVDAARRREAGL